MRVTIIYDEESLAKAKLTLARWILAVPHALGPVCPAGPGDQVPEDDPSIQALPGDPRDHRA